MKKLFIVTDYHTVGKDGSVTRSEHYCFECNNDEKSNDELFDECVKQIPDNATVCDWLVEKTM